MPTKATVETDVALPAEFDHRFNCETLRGSCREPLSCRRVLILEQQAARHGAARRRDALLLENVPRLNVPRFHVD
jgi:hypothetical protein